MARGRKTTSRTAQNRLGGKEAEAAQNASIEKQIAEIQRRTTEQALSVQLKKVVSDITVGNVTYAKADEVSPFTAKEFVAAIDARGTLDMSNDLGADVTHATMIERMLINCESDQPFICVYVRNPATTARFAMLQHYVEASFKCPVQSNLQGWILHYGKMFILGGVHLTLKGAVQTIMAFFHQELIEYLEENLEKHLTIAD
tara:strand:+ start:1810 stop:2412 length:603 start_codon:yes stop_codon:yes gene_type:complete